MLYTDDIKDWIVLELTNVNTSASSLVNLFSLPPNANTSATLGGQIIENFPATEFPAPLVVEFNDGTSTTGIPVTASDIDSLISQIQTYLDSNGGGQVFYLEPSVGIYDIYAFSPTLTLEKIKGTIDYNATALNLDVINDSTVNVSVLSSSLSYNELVSELNNQPYKLEYVNVYANNIDQVNTPFTKSDGEMNGHIDVNYNHPVLSAIPKQFVIERVLIEFSPNSTSSLQYTINAGQTVRLIFQYSHVDMLKIPAKTINVDEMIIEGIEKEIPVQSTIPPILQLIKRYTTSSGKELKNVLKRHIAPDKVTYIEVISAFDKRDFKEL